MLVSNVRAARLAAGLTQEELSRRCGVSRQTIISIERGVHAPTLMLAFLLARELDQRVDALFALEGTP
ncbi:helix-turn-helix transcriptional regulator [Microbacterium sp. Clip185]|uniref:helix-turn-helix transcriptional regulator n=1 Tax=Microbacterium sp. Clip185 TaxID=3025663 RepID=UPI0023669AD1|nr:helix-turn-helix transcriptional regulator [Microbacterium sp. Clip185]WDG17879.1 helix-turn-helix transcriptional regulator [Microbacterium sp. Clip185]